MFYFFNMYNIASHWLHTSVSLRLSKEKDEEMREVTKPWTLLSFVSFIIIFLVLKHNWRNLRKKKKQFFVPILWEKSKRKKEKISKKKKLKSQICWNIKIKWRVAESASKWWLQEKIWSERKIKLATHKKSQQSSYKNWSIDRVCKKLCLEHKLKLILQDTKQNAESKSQENKKRSWRICKTKAFIARNKFAQRDFWASCET